MLSGCFWVFGDSHRFRVEGSPQTSGLVSELEIRDAVDELIELLGDSGTELEGAVARPCPVDDPLHPALEVGEFGELIVLEVAGGTELSHPPPVVELEEVEPCGRDLCPPRGEVAGARLSLGGDFVDVLTEIQQPSEERGRVCSVGVGDAPQALEMTQAYSRFHV